MLLNCIAYILLHNAAVMLLLSLPIFFFGAVAFRLLGSLAPQHFRLVLDRIDLVPALVAIQEIEQVADDGVGHRVVVAAVVAEVSGFRRSLA